MKKWDAVQRCIIEMLDTSLAPEEREFAMQRALALIEEIADAFPDIEKEGIKMYTCQSCGEVFGYADEVVFDGDRSKVVDELNPDWTTCHCFVCYDEGVEEELEMEIYECMVCGADLASSDDTCMECAKEEE